MHGFYLLTPSENRLRTLYINPKRLTLKHFSHDLTVSGSIAASNASILRILCESIILRVVRCKAMFRGFFTIFLNNVTNQCSLVAVNQQNASNRSIVSSYKVWIVLLSRYLYARIHIWPLVSRLTAWNNFFTLQPRASQIFLFISGRSRGEPGRIDRLPTV